MTELTQSFLDFAHDKRADLVGFAPISRFDDVPAKHHPATIFPETQTVVVVGKRITRGTLRGVEEGTQLELYGQYGLSWLADRMLAITTIALATFLEDHRHEAVPIQDLPPQTPPSGVAVRPDLPAPNVMIDVRQAAVRAGLGEIGWCGEVLTPVYGPRQRFQIILTDAALTPTPLLQQAVCDQCGECRTTCPLGAYDGSESELAIAGQSYRVGHCNPAVCRSCKNGARPNPHHAAGLPDRLGALCIRSCVDHLERAGLVSNGFTAPFRKRPAWQIDRTGAPSLATSGE
ncbi:MAG: hypothetical protein IT204_17365 [Fimbriimonadaceae bacterium]|nr:hypothetical protein [Fimbriimonadaceae bacterium]